MSARPRPTSDAPATSVEPRASREPAASRRQPTWDERAARGNQRSATWVILPALGMHRITVSFAAALASASLILAILGSPARAQPTPPPATETSQVYTVVTGDTCRSIANQHLGSAQAIAALHRLNPQLGPTPHKLVAGQKLLLPRKGPRPADANLTAARGDVAVRKPTAVAWDAAQRGMDLFRAWRVGARAKASAEVTFRDSSQLRLRENTVVIIYGPAAPRQPLVAMRAEIEGGSLEARLAAASGAGPAPEVLTPSSLSTLTQGNALFSVDPASGTSLIANHDGQPVAVRSVTKQKKPRGAAVKVDKGMGSRVEVGKLPEPPRPLPPPPAFAFTTPQLTVATFAATTTVSVAWSEASSLHAYRVVVMDAAGVEQNAVTLPPRRTSFELTGVPPGRLKIAVSTIDEAGFEGAPALVDVDVVAVAMTAPSGPSAGPPAPAPADGTAVAAAPLKVALGARLVEPPGMTCVLISTKGGTMAEPAPSPSKVASQPGKYYVSCVPAGSALDPATIPPLPSRGDEPSHPGGLVEVVGVTVKPVGPPPSLSPDRATEISLTVESEVPIGPGLDVRSQLAQLGGPVIDGKKWDGKTLTFTVHPTLPQPELATVELFLGDVTLATFSIPVAAAARTIEVAQPRWRFELGGFAGLLLPAADSRIGAPELARDALASGPLLGARAAVRQTARPWLAARLELGLAALSQVGTPDTATFFFPSAALALRPLSRGAIELWAFGGAGVGHLSVSPNSARPETALSLDGGASVQMTHNDLTVRLDATWSLLDPGGESELWPSVRLGLSKTFDR